MKKVLIALAAIVAILLVVIATRPSDFHIERSTTIAAPPDVVFAQVNDFHKWGAWSPWEKLDPNMNRTLSGAEAGKGAVYEWASTQDNVGSGRMTIEESTPPSKVGIKLEFLKPWEATNTCNFTFVPDATGTKVTWAMDGKNGFMMKAMGLFMNMDEMVGADFERGLVNLKHVSQAEAKRIAAEAEARATADAAAAAAATAAAAAPEASPAPDAGAPAKN